ncbi:hypothetical protein ACOJBM_40135 [Rhizobium beringeri]
MSLRTSENSAASECVFLEALTRAVPAHSAVVRAPAARRQPQRKWGDYDFIYPQYPCWNIPSSERGDLRAHRVIRDGRLLQRAGFQRRLEAYRS